MKKLIAGVIIVALIGALTIPRSATATVPVIDVAAIAQAVLEVAWSAADYAVQIEEVANTIEMIENQILMLENMALNIKNLQWSALPMIGGPLTQLQRIIGKARGIGYNAELIGEQYNTLYPEFHMPSGSGNHLWRTETLRGYQFYWNTQIRDAYQTAFESQAQMAQNIDLGQAATQDALRHSEAAEGNLQAQQAGNELLGVVAAQQIETQQLLATQARAQASADMMRAAEKDQALLHSQYWIEDFAVVQPTEGLRELPTSLR